MAHISIVEGGLLLHCPKLLLLLGSNGYWWNFFVYSLQQMSFFDGRLLHLFDSIRISSEVGRYLLSFATDRSTSKNCRLIIVAPLLFRKLFYSLT